MKLKHIYDHVGLIFSAVFLAATISNANASALSTLVNNMKPGEWAALDTQGFTDLLYTTLNNPEDGLDYGNTILDFAESAAWDPTSRQFLFLGAPHGRAWRFIIYDEASNTWRDGPLPRDCMKYGAGGSTPNPNYCGGHAFDWIAFDAAAGRMFHTYWKFGPEIDIYHVASNSWTRSSTPPSDVANFLQAYRYSGMEWFPERNAIYVFASSRLARLSIDTSEWEILPDRYPMTNGDGSTTTSNYHNVIQYSPKSKVMVFGGGNDFNNVISNTNYYRQMYRMDAQGVVTRLKDAPIPIRVVDGPNGSQPGTLITDDPVSGKFLVLAKDKAFYELDALADAWRALPQAPIQGHGVSAPIPNYGVVMHVTDSGVWIYKHNEACQNCTIPQTPTGVSIQIQ